MPSFLLTSDTGVPITGALPTFIAYRDISNVARSQPTITHLSGGTYTFTSPALDITDGVGYIIDCKSGSNPRYGAGYVGGSKVFFPAYDLTGSLQSGLTPTFVVYDKPDGTPVTPPTIVPLANGLYGFIPTASDLTNLIRWEVYLGSASLPDRVQGDLEGGGNSSGGNPPEVSNILPAPGTQIYATTPITLDVTDDTGFGRIMLVAQFSNGDYDVIHDGDNFAPNYSGSSTLVALVSGSQFSVLKAGGWRANPTFRVFAFDSAGNQNV